MKTIGLLAGCATAVLISGCGIDPADTAEPHEGVATEKLVIEPNAFVAFHVVNSLHCAFNEVMIGAHLDQGKAICGALNHGYKVQVSLVDPVHGTQVGNPAMHGCPPNFFIQGMDLFGPGQDETLNCVSLQTANNEALSYSSTLQDNHGATQSTIYGLSPKMHACPKVFGMVGIHRDQNNFFCAD